MRIKKILAIFVVAICTFSCSQVFASANTYTKSLTSKGMTGALDYFGSKYKYAKVTIKPDNSKALYTVSLIGTDYVSKLYSVSPIGTSIEFSGSSSRTIYILPRSGMGCPGGYCFGVGSNYSATTMIQGNECNGEMCSLYGIRIKNKKNLTYNVTYSYEFFN